MPVTLMIPMLALFEKTDLVLAAGLTMVIAGLVWSYKKRRRMQSTQPVLTPNEQLERNKQMRGVRGDLETLMVEIEQFSKRLSSHLDAKAAALEHLLKRVDDRIAELKRLDGAAGLNRSATDVDPYERPADELSDPSFPAESARKPAGSAASSLPEDPLSRSVYQLADQGLDAYTIAQRLQEHVGKIELILALRTA